MKKTGLAYQLDFSIESLGVVPVMPHAYILLLDDWESMMLDGNDSAAEIEQQQSQIMVHCKNLCEARA